jgi:hypothetical protein
MMGGDDSRELVAAAALALGTPWRELGGRLEL